MKPLLERDQIKRAIGRLSQGSSDFDLNPDIQTPARQDLRAAGVLIALMRGRGGTRVVLTKRSSALKHHPGQIAFPGGAVDPDDADVVQAAQREAWEEIGLEPDNTEVLGRLPPHQTVTGFQVTPVIAFVRDHFTPKPEPGEVDEVFSVPLSHVTDIHQFQIQSRIWAGQRRYYYTVPYGPYYIWGATARIFRALGEGMSP